MDFEFSSFSISSLEEDQNSITNSSQQGISRQES